jgi:stage II sporulation protein AA (anti-sigma F factor antagonist)
MDMQLDWEGPRRILLSCSGDIGWNDQDALADKVSAAVENIQQPQVIMNLEEVEMVNSAGIGALLKTLKLLQKQGGQMVLANVPPNLMRLFSTVGLDRLAHVSGNMKDARTYLDESS